MAPIDLPIRSLIFMENLSHQPRQKLKNFIFTALQFFRGRDPKGCGFLGSSVQNIGSNEFFALGICCFQENASASGCPRGGSLCGRNLQEKRIALSTFPVPCAGRSGLCPAAPGSTLCTTFRGFDNAERVCQPSAAPQDPTGSKQVRHTDEQEIPPRNQAGWDDLEEKRESSSPENTVWRAMQ